MIVYLAILVAFGIFAVALIGQRHRLDDLASEIDTLRAELHFHHTQPREVEPRRRVSRTGPIR